MENKGSESLNGEITDGHQSESGKVGGKVRKILNIVLDVFLYLFLVLCIALLAFSLAARKNDGATNLFGYEMRIVVSQSMEKCDAFDASGYKIKDIKLNSMVFIQRVPEDAEKSREWYSELEVGDVLTFSYLISSSQEIITHRISNITTTDTGYIIELQGDNRADGASVATQTIYTSSKDYPDNKAAFNYVIGKVTGQSVVLGYIAYGISRPLGVALIIIVPCSIIIIWQIVRVILMLGDERKKKTALKIEQAELLAAKESEEREKQARELEELKRKVAEMEKRQSDIGGGGDES